MPVELLVFTLSSWTFLIYSPSSYKPWLLVIQHRLCQHPQKWKERNKAVTKTVLLKHPWHVNHLGYCYNTDYDSLCPAWGLNSAFLTSSKELLMLQICGPLWVARTLNTGTCNLIPRLNSGSDETGVLLFVRGLAMTRWNREPVVTQPLSPVDEIMTCGENRRLHWDVKTRCVLALLESLISLAPEAQLNPRKPGCSTLLQIARANNFLSLLNQLELDLHYLQPRFLTIKNWKVMAKQIMIYPYGRIMQLPKKKPIISKIYIYWDGQII